MEGIQIVLLSQQQTVVEIMSREQRLDTNEPPNGDRSGEGAQVPTSNRVHAILCQMTAVIGRKWHPVIVYCLLEDDSLGFSDLESEIDGISSKMLSQALEDLERNGLLERTVINTRPFRVEYSLTEAGQELERVIAAMCDWGTEYVDPDDRSEEDAN